MAQPKLFTSPTAWVVWLSLLLTASMMALQYLFPESSLPQDTMAWGLTFIIGGYTGLDRLAQVVKSRSLEYGKADKGNVRKLRWIIITLFLLVVEAIFLQTFLKTKGLALDTLLIAFSTAAGTFAIGNKVITAAEFTEGTHSDGETTGK